uniref:Ovule protein n=1 Tax=Steinernema glaseri TaxID=37863 RepID=A0A1I7Z3S7_9BILA
MNCLNTSLTNKVHCKPPFDTPRLKFVDNQMLQESSCSLLFKSVKRRSTENLVTMLASQCVPDGFSPSEA